MPFEHMRDGPDLRCHFRTLRSVQDIARLSVRYATVRPGDPHLPRSPVSESFESRVNVITVRLLSRSFRDPEMNECVRLQTELEHAKLGAGPPWKYSPMTTEVRALFAERNKAGVAVPERPTGGRLADEAR